MSLPASPRLAIFVQPRLLGSMLTKILDELAMDEVVHLDTNETMPADSRFDATVTSGPLPDTIAANVIIELPDNDGSSGIGRVLMRHSAQYVVIAGLADVFGLLDRHCPGPMPRWTNV